MAGLVRAMTIPNFGIANPSGIPGIRPGMTGTHALAARRRAKLKKIAASNVSVPITV
jgi:hypothetical protein